MLWQGRTPPELNGIIILDLLELLASATSTYMTIHQLGEGYNTLSFTDSSSALLCMKNHHSTHSKRISMTRYIDGWDGITS